MRVHYMGIFFSKYILYHYDLRLVEFSDVELQIQRPDYKVTSDFQPRGGSAPLNSAVIKSQL